MIDIITCEQSDESMLVHREENGVNAVRYLKPIAENHKQQIPSENVTDSLRYFPQLEMNVFYAPKFQRIELIASLQGHRIPWPRSIQKIVHRTGKRVLRLKFHPIFQIDENVVVQHHVARHLRENGQRDEHRQESQVLRHSGEEARWKKFRNAKLGKCRHENYDNQNVETMSEATVVDGFASFGRDVLIKIAETIVQILQLFAMFDRQHGGQHMEHAIDHDETDGGRLQVDHFVAVDLDVQLNGGNGDDEQNEQNVETESAKKLPPTRWFPVNRSRIERAETDVIE